MIQAKEMEKAALGALAAALAAGNETKIVVEGQGVKVVTQLLSFPTLDDNSTNLTDRAVPEVLVDFPGDDEGGGGATIFIPITALALSSDPLAVMVSSFDAQNVPAVMTDRGGGDAGGGEAGEDVEEIKSVISISLTTLEGETLSVSGLRDQIGRAHV